jgi:hypothetical protein
MSKFLLKKVEDLKKWDAFVAESPQGTLCSTSGYLRAIDHPFELLYVIKGREVRAGIALMKDEDGNCILHDHVIYNGVLFSSLHKDQSVSKRLSDEFEILTFISSELPQKFSRVEMALSPEIYDLRPFLWHNYHDYQAQKWELDLRYTSYVNISACAEDKLEENALFKELGTSRRQEVRYARQDGIFAESSSNVGLLVDLYEKTMQKNGAEISASQFCQMESFLNKILEEKTGKQFIVKNDQNKVASVAFFGFDNKRAYYLFGGNDPDTKASYSGTIVLWDAFVALSREGIREVDMEGVNSPQRGWFKLSMGGSLLPYYQIYFGR